MDEQATKNWGSYMYTENELDFDEAAATPEPELEPEWARMPRLRIGHLMLWTALCAALMSWSRPVPPNVTSDPYSWLRTITYIVQSVAAGGVMMGAILFVGYRVRYKRPLVTEPGHWLLLVGAGSILFYRSMTSAGIVVMESSNLARIQFMDWALTMVFYLVPATVFVVAFLNTAAVRWKAMFVGLAVLLIARSIDTVCLWLGLDVLGDFRWVVFSSGAQWATLWLFDLVVNLWLVYCVIADLITRQHRDWLHWLGIAMELLFFAAGLSWAIGIVIG